MPQRVAALPRPPHLPLIAAASLGALAVLELLLQRGSVPRMVVAPSIARTGGDTARVSFVVLLGLLCLSTTLLLALPHPVVAAVIMSVASVLSLTLFETLTVAGMVAQLAVAYRLGRGGTPAMAAVIGLPFLVATLVGPADLDHRVRTVLLASLAPIAGLTGVARRARQEALENSARQRAVAGSLLENTARGERARIARELHDVVAHHISMIAVQAETARVATAGMPPDGAKRLLEIGDTARSALTEMRRLLGVLREDTRSGTAAGGDTEERRRPQPGLQQLNDLLDAARDASGTAVRLIVDGSPELLDPGVELAAYRIVQESLTNARRHAPGAAIDVELHYAGDALWLRVRDNGPGPASASSGGGHGLLGMRERAAAVGGEVRTGPAFGGGFLVEAKFPTTTGSSR